jgi:hypothetical protein
MIDKEEYRPAGIMNREDIIAYLSDDVLLGNITEQVGQLGGPGGPIDLLREFEERHSMLKALNEGDSEMLNDLRTARKQGYKKVLDAISLSFNIVLPETYLLESAMALVTRQLYEFFVLSYRNNLTRFLVSYCFENRKALAGAYKSEESKKDLMMSTVRKTVRTQEDAIVVYHLAEVLRDLPGTIDDPVYVLQVLLAQDEENDNYQMVKGILFDEEGESGFLAGDDFCEKFISPSISDVSGPSLQVKVRADFIALVSR